MGKQKEKNKRHRRQAANTVQVHRSEVNPAPYNPRWMDDDARAELDASLERHGAVLPLVWNRRTGNLVGGHRRLDWLDRRHDDLDYELTVTPVDLDENDEKRLNVLLNNPAAQGTFHVARLCEVIQEIGFDGTAFTPTNIRQFVPVEMAEAIFGPPEVPEPLQVTPVAAQQMTIVIVFQSRKGADAFSELLGFDPHDRYVDGYRLRSLLQELYLPTCGDTDPM